MSTGENEKLVWCWTCGHKQPVHVGDAPKTWLMHQACKSCGDVGNLREEIMIRMVRAPELLDVQGYLAPLNCRCSPSPVTDDNEREGA